MTAARNAATKAGTALDVEAVRAQFPILSTTMRGKPLAYLDNANSTQKPLPVLDAERGFYETRYANIHRGVYHLSQQATDLYDAAREKVRTLLHAKHASEIVFVRGTTEAMNLVAHGLSSLLLDAGDEVVITTLEHHSGIVPWQLACQRVGAALRVLPMTDDGALRLDEAEKILSGPRVRILSAIHVSNALGNVLPVEDLIAMARRRGIAVVLDGAQAVPHMPVDVRALDCDFYCFSGHKIYGPTGIGALYGKSEWLERLPPWQGGGDMIRSVTFEKTTYNEVPYKFEAGTPNIAGAIGLGAAIDFLGSVGFERIEAHERDLLDHAIASISLIPEVRVLGGTRGKRGVVSFVVDGIHPHDVGTVLDLEGVAVRAGHHCAQPLMERLGVPATVRASFGVYNTREEVDRLSDAIRKAAEVFR
jgi:cysteine desulfurase/selenocysteine lyase